VLLLRLAPLLLVLLHAALLPDRAAGQGAGDAGVVLIVAVTDRMNGAPVPSALVMLAPITAGGDRGSARVFGLDPDGRVRTSPLPPGRYLLEVRAPGYQPLDDRLEVRGPSPASLSVQLAPEVMEVEGVAALATRNPFLEEGGFYERQAQGFGVTFTREQLASLGVYQTSDVFRTLSGVGFDYAGSPTAPFISFRQGCRPDVVLDGANLGPNVRLDDLVNPSDIEGLEVYRGATVPGTLSSSSCGAVMVWTLSRTPEGARPFSWNRIIFGAVVLALAQLIRP
jgi:hypothetical protein